MASIADTHLALWLIDGSDKLPEAAFKAMCAPGGEWYISIISAWEVMLKHASHPDQMLIDAPTFLRDCEAAGFKLLTLKPEHIIAASLIPPAAHHKDPFDRMLLAQAHSENFELVTHDSAFRGYDDTHIVIV